MPVGTPPDAAPCAENFEFMEVRMEPDKAPPLIIGVIAVVIVVVLALAYFFGAYPDARW